MVGFRIALHTEKIKNKLIAVLAYLIVHEQSKQLELPSIRKYPEKEKNSELRHSIVLNLVAFFMWFLLRVWSVWIWTILRIGIQRRPQGVFNPHSWLEFHITYTTSIKWDSTKFPKKYEFVINGSLLSFSEVEFSWIMLSPMQFVSYGPFGSKSFIF